MLTENSTLQTLDISYNAIKPKGAKFLADALKPNACLKSNLRSLDITCNKLAPLGMQSLCEMLVVNRTIQELKCTSNNLEEEGAAYLANVLQFNYTLSVLDVESNQIGPVGASVLMDHLLEKNRTLESLNLAWNGVGSNVAEELAQVLKRNEVLTNVNLKGNGITTDGILALAEALLYNNSLTKLDVSHNRFDKYGAFALTNAMGKPTCPMEPQNLVWDHNPSLSEDGVASLKRIPQLRRNRVHWLDRLIGDLGEGNLHNINLTQRNVADEEVLLLAEAMHSCKQAKLRTFPFIRTMFLAGPRLTSRSLIPFFEACLPSPAKVMRLYLQDCSHMEEESIPIIAVNLPRSKSLEVLCLNNCSVTSRGAALLARGLNLNTTLRRLNLNHNEIGDAGLVELAAVLPHQTLKALSVNDNKITDASMSAIGLAQLQELHLNRNSITDRGALAFSQTIDETTCCLTFLDLQFNQVTKKGGDTLKIFLPETIPGSVIVDY
jgi:Ran GTPase-activating protein (RanGAP) involved in mRNA processing and transport